MTEKRFTIGMLKNFVNDNKTNYCYSLELPSEAEHLCNLLNELNDENEQLKSENNMLKVTIGRNEAYIERLTQTSEWKTSAYDGDVE